MLAMSELWERALEVSTDGGDHFKHVATSRQALECLLTSWPEKGGSAYSIAKRTCALAIEGRATSLAASQAFEAAAREAGLIRQ